MERQSLLVARDAIPNQTPALIALTTIFFLLSTAFMAARLIWRYTRSQRGWDDVFAISAYINLVILSAFGYMAAHYNFGKHKSDIPTTFPHAMYWFWLYQIFYKILGGLTKLTFCALYYRIFKRRDYRRIIWATIMIISTGTVAFTFGTIFQCTPIKYNWNKRIEEGHCISFMGFWYAHAIFNTVMDIVVFVLPIPLISTLHMAKKTKVGLASVFALGAFTIAASIVRMVMLRKSAQAIAVDPTWGSMPALIWTEIEANTAVICCTLPALRQLAVRIWRAVLGKKGLETTVDEEGSRGGSGNKPLPIQPTNSANPFNDPPYTDPTYFPGKSQAPSCSPAAKHIPIRNPLPYFGTWSSAHYSPPPSTANKQEIFHLNSHPTESTSRRWTDKFLPTKLYARSHDEDLELGPPAPKISDHPPVIPASPTYARFRDVKVESVHLPTVEGQKRPQHYKPRNESIGNRESGATGGLTLEEILREGPYGK